VGAFLKVLFASWSVNSQIITLPNFLRHGDHEPALELMNKCTFVTAEDFETAWERVEEAFPKQFRGDEPDMTTGELLQLTLDQHEAWVGHRPSFFEQAGYAISYVLVPKRYWCNRLLFFEHLRDNRSWHFHLCMKLYYAFMALAVILFCWGLFYTTSHYLLFQFKDLMPDALRRMPPPHEAPKVYGQASRLIPKIAKTMKKLDRFF